MEAVPPAQALSDAIKVSDDTLAGVLAEIAEGKRDGEDLDVLEGIIQQRRQRLSQPPCPYCGEFLVAGRAHLHPDERSGQMVAIGLYEPDLGPQVRPSKQPPDGDAWPRNKDGSPMSPEQIAGREK